MSNLPPHQTVKVFLLKTKLEPKVDALCSWTQTFHGISGIFLSSRVQRKNCIQYTKYYILYTEQVFLFFCGNFSICFTFWHVIMIKDWHPLDIGGYPLPNPLMLLCSVSKIKIWRYLNNLTHLLNGSGPQIMIKNFCSFQLGD